MSNKKLIANILIIFLITRGIFAAVYFIYCAVCNDNSGFEAVFGRWDTEHYSDIIENGYHYTNKSNGQANWAFFPLFPLACRGVRMISGGNLSPFWCGIIVSNVCLVIAAFFAVKLIRDRGIVKGERGVLFTGLSKNGSLLAWFLMLGPFTVYFSAVYTESLFVLLLVLFFYAAQKELFPLAGMFAALAGATRSVGVLLIIPLIMAMYSSYRKEKGSGNIFCFVGNVFARPARLFSLLLVPVGLFCYMLYLYFFLGDAFGFIHVQVAWRNEDFLPVIGVLKHYLFSTGEIHYTISAWICIAAFVLYIWMFVKGLRREAVWGIISLLLPLTSHIMSTPRFISGSFVVWVGMYLLIKSMKSHGAQVFFTLLLYAGGVATIALWYAQAHIIM